MEEAWVEDRNAQLGQFIFFGTTYMGILNNPDSPVVALILQIYQMENFCYSELNRSSRFKDESKVATLGPWAAALYEIIWYTQRFRKVSDIN